MTKPTLTYFDFPASRGEECRIALHVAGVEFTDRRLTRDQWLALKPSSPFGSMPLLDLPGKPTLGQSNAILLYVGREYGLHPTDNFEAARHEALLAYCEEMRHHVSPLLRISEDKQRVREDLAANYLQTWGRNVENQLGDGPFLAGSKLHVADIKLYMAVRWFASGVVDHVPRSVFEAFPKLTRLFTSVGEHPRVAEWIARTT